jgi:hypothetical protein
VIQIQLRRYGMQIGGESIENVLMPKPGPIFIINEINIFIFSYA